MREAAFPDEHALCERCGYPLKGLSADGVCPECGQPIEASHPRHRTWPAWQRRMSPRAWAITFREMIWSPGRFYRGMRVDGSNVPPRLFLLSIAVMAAVGWAMMAGLVIHRGVLQAWAQGMIAGDAVLMLSYIEALGVTYFSGRRGWRVPLRLAERVVCYAGVGWPPAAAAMACLYVLDASGRLGRWWPPMLGAWVVGRAVVYALAASGATLGFETLVWLGARQVRYANRPAALQSRERSKRSERAFRTGR